MSLKLIEPCRKCFARIFSSSKPVRRVGKRTRASRKGACPASRASAQPVVPQYELGADGKLYELVGGQREGEKSYRFIVEYDNFTPEEKQALEKLWAC